MSIDGKPPAEESSAAEEMRPLPDGGLGAAMPDWLRRPPAWRDLPKAQPGARARELPEPDRSVIDPRTLIEVSDLPLWLQAIAARDGGNPPGTPASGDEQAPEETTMASNGDSTGERTTGERTVQFEPVDKERFERREEVTHEIVGGPDSTLRPSDNTILGMTRQTVMWVGLIILAVILVILFLTVF